MIWDFGTCRTCKHDKVLNLSFFTFYKSVITITEMTLKGWGLLQTKLEICWNVFKEKKRDYCYVGVSSSLFYFK